MSRLDKEELEILDAFEADEMQRAPDVKDRKARHQQYADAMFKKRCPYQHQAFFQGSQGAPEEGAGRRYSLSNTGCQYPSQVCGRSLT